MVLGVREPVELARQVEDHPQLPAASCERVSGCGVMGLPFGSGHGCGIHSDDPPDEHRRLGAAAHGLALAPCPRRYGTLAGWSLGIGTVKLTGRTSTQQRFDSNPLRIWFVTDSHATVEGQDLRPIGPLAEQAHLTDFYIPQRGIFATGRVFVTPVAAGVPAAVPAAEVAR